MFIRVKVNNFYFVSEFFDLKYNYKDYNKYSNHNHDVDKTSTTTTC